MARCVLGPIISQISGSLGGFTFRNCNGGLIIQPRANVCQRDTEFQMIHRGFVSDAANAWNALDEDIKRAWRTLARQERIPDVFSRGRRWPARELFTCFYLYARHQYTPLPARWLPQTPIFHASMGLDVFYQSAFETTPGVYTTKNECYGYYPISIDPSGPSGYADDCICSFWFGFKRFQSSTEPRRWFKLAPLPPAWFMYGLPATPYNNGQAYINYGDFWKAIMGHAPGLNIGQSSPVTPKWFCAVKGITVTDERLYYSPVTSGQTFLGNVPTVIPVIGANDIYPEPAPAIYRNPPLNIPTTEY